jgi:hypothetical protein
MHLERVLVRPIGTSEKCDGVDVSTRSLIVASAAREQQEEEEMQTGIGCMLMRGAGTVRWVTFLPESAATLAARRELEK